MSQQRRKGSIRIEPFRHKVEMDPKFGEKSWKVLEDAIHEIYNHNASNLSFEELYRNAYNMVLHKCGERLYSGLVSTMQTHLRQVALSIEAAPGARFLEELNTQWADHNQSLQMIRDILMYMDRVYVAAQNRTPVHELGLNMWRDVVVKTSKIRSRLLPTLLELVQKERSGEIIDRSLMHHIVKMFVELGVQVYQDEFETPFLNSAAEFYQIEAQQNLATCDCSDYLKVAERRLHEEMERVKMYLDLRSEPKILAVVEKEMIGSHMKRLVEMENSGLVPMLQNDKYEDIGRMFSLFRRVQGGLQTMRDVMGSHVKEAGKQLVTDTEKLKDPVEFVQRLLDERDKYDKIIQRSFANEKTFQNTLNSAFEHFMNLNPRSPEFISLFVDDKLRKGLKGVSEDEVEAMLDKVMTLFRYLQEKDVFEKYYKMHLSKRLLNKDKRSVSDDAERSMLVKLKTECGYQFTSKLESMFTDVKTSEDTMQAFQQALSASGNIPPGPSLSVMVLTSGSWPTQPGAHCQLPKELNAICERFQNHYLGAHTGRRLTWQVNMGFADIKAVFEERKYELNVTTYSMCILMLFQTADRLTYKEIAETTEIPTADLKRALQSMSLMKGKNVLRKEPVGKDVNDDDVFHFNDKFRSQTLKVKIGLVSSQKETEPEKQETREKIEEDRKPQIEAAIVRIMKSRRVLDHNNIVTEVTKQLSSRFMANPTVIKKRIESLIEREFLERDKNDRKLYRYLA